LARPPEERARVVTIGGREVLFSFTGEGGDKERRWKVDCCSLTDGRQVRHGTVGEQEEAPRGTT